MTVPNKTYSVKYQGDGSANSIYFIPFGFTDDAVVYVETIDSSGVATRAYSGIDYDLTASTSDGSSIPLADAPAEAGWIKWIGTSPTDIVHIFREETAVFSTNLNPTLSSLKLVEEGVDNIVRAMSRTCKRSDKNPEKFDALGREITGLGVPKRGDDATSKGTLDNMDITPSIGYPSSVVKDNGKFLTPRTYVPATTGGVSWATVGQTPTPTSEASDALKCVGTGPNQWEWTTINWIPEPPNDGLGAFLAVDQAGNQTWDRVYRVPVAVSGSVDDVIRVLPGEILSWRTIPEETPYATTATAKDKRFAMRKTGNNLAWGPRITYGSVSVTVDAPNLASSFGGDGFHGGLGSEPMVTFSVAHGMKGDIGLDTAPDRVFIMVETEKYDSADSGGPDCIPFWRARLYSEEDTVPGITSTTLSGVAMYLNTNDDMTTVGVNSNAPYFSLPLGSYSATTDTYTLKINFLAFKD